MDGGLGLPISRNGVNSHSQPKLSSWTSSSNGSQKLAGGPTLIDEPFKKLKKPSFLSQVQCRSSTPTPSNNGVCRTEGDKKHGGMVRGMPTSTLFKSLTDFSSVDTTDPKVQYILQKNKCKSYMKLHYFRIKASFIMGLCAPSMAVRLGIASNSTNQQQIVDLLLPAMCLQLRHCYYGEDA